MRATKCAVCLDTLHFVRPSSRCAGKSFVCNVYQTQMFKGAVVRVLSSYQYVPGSIPGLGILIGLSWLVLYSAEERGFSPASPAYPSLQTPTYELILFDFRTVASSSAQALNILILKLFASWEVRITKMLSAGRGNLFQDRGHSFSLYGPTLSC